MSGAGEVTIDDNAVASPDQRRQRKDAPERSMSEDAGGGVVLEAPVGNSGPTPEEALANAQKALEQRDATIAAERSRAQQAESEAARARDEAARARQRGASERQTAIASAMETAKADKANASQMLKTAREAGDLDGELKANELLSSANYRLNRTADELEMIKANGAAEHDSGGDHQQQQQRQPVVSAEAQAWINAHPQFKTDASYRQKALAAHGQALLDGCAVDSPAYFRYLDDADTAFKRSQGREDDMDRGKKGGREQSSEGAPPSRGNGGHGGASRVVNTKMGPLTVTRRADGKLGIQIPPAARADFEEGAKITGLSLGDYAYEQLKIADEVAAGGNGGLITEEGSTYR